MAVIDSYTEDNVSAQWNLRDVHPSAGDTSASGQSFTGNGYLMTSVKFYLKKYGSPAGTMVAKLYAHSGTYGTSSLPTGAALATSAALTLQSLTTDYQLIEFTFTVPYLTVNGTKYCVDVEIASATQISSSHYLIVGQDNTSVPAGAGNNFRWTSGAWAAAGTYAQIFYALGNAVTKTITIGDGLVVVV